jgi:hypothetical protein
MSVRRNRKRVAALAGALAMGLVVPAWAVDGVIEINQASVKAAGGFPFVISKSGSYRLTSNLDVTDATARAGGSLAEQTTAIQITAADVTIDLNGFEIKGPTSCSGAPAPSCSCTPSGGTGRGIDGSATVGVAVMNGTIRGMGSWGVLLGRQSRVERVRVVGNGDEGIMGAETVTNCTADGNGGSGISSADTVLDSTANENCKDGIIAANTVVNCTARNNAANGIEGKTTANCTAVSNGDIGIFATTAIGCTVTSNVGINLSATGVVAHNVCGPPLAACP